MVTFQIFSKETLSACVQQKTDSEVMKVGVREQLVLSRESQTDMPERPKSLASKTDRRAKWHGQVLLLEFILLLSVYITSMWSLSASVGHQEGLQQHQKYTSFHTHPHILQWVLLLTPAIKLESAESQNIPKPSVTSLNIFFRLTRAPKTQFAFI